MKTRMNVKRWLWLAVLLAAGVPAAHAYYDPAPQRWINRDPIGERGGINLHSFVENGPVHWFDPFGRARKKRVPPITPLPPLPPPYDGCNDEQIKFLKDGLKDACDKIKSKCFADCLKDPALVKALRAKCDNPDNTRYACAKTGTDPNCGEDICAYADVGGNRITLCTPYNQCDTPGCTVLHELGHNAGAEGDRANDVQKCGSGCNQNPKPHPK